MPRLFSIRYVPRHPRRRFPPADPLWADCEAADADAILAALELEGDERAAASNEIDALMRALRRTAKERTAAILARIC
jgi:hypothetical protein